MRSRATIFIVVAGALLAAACSDDPGELRPASGPPPVKEAEKQPEGPPPPPGTQGAAGYRYFEQSAYEALKSCASCHTTGTNGAPILFGTDVKTTYAALDGNGLVLEASALLTKGPHASGKAPALAPTSEAIVRKWLGIEAQERVGDKSPETIYAKVAKCMNTELFAKIELCTARTQPRIGENGNNCTGCKFESCSNCHAAGGQNTGFWCSTTNVGGVLKTDTTDTLTASKALPYIRRYIGFAGGAPIASNAILNKSSTTEVADVPYAHPWFELDAARQKALQAFVNDAITRYAAGTCGP